MILGITNRVLIFLLCLSVSDYIAMLKNRVSLEQVVSAVVELRDSGKSLLGKCPFHSERTPSFHVYKGENKFHCFGCQANGDTVDFIEKFYNLPQIDAIKRLKELAGITDEGWQKSARIFKSPVEQKEKTYRTYTMAEWDKCAQRLQNAEGLPGREYLTTRGIGDEVSKRLKIGFREDGTRFVGDGSKDTDENRERNAVMRVSPWIGLPYIEGDKIVSIKWRAISGEISKGDRFRYESNMQPCGVFNAETIDPLDELFVTEGELDAITLEQAGLRAVSVRGASHKLDARTKDALIRAERIYIAGDNEASGIGLKAMERLLKDLGDKAHMLLWPRADNEEKKDANAFFVSDCAGRVDVFRTRVLALAAEARKPTSPHFKAVSEIIRRLKDAVSPLDDPRRFRFPFAEVDCMVHLVPGDIGVIFASQTGTGKSAFTTQSVLHNAMDIEPRKTAVIYTPDLKPERHARMMVSQIARKDRMTLCAEDYDLTANEMAGAQVYLGFDPDARTASDALDVCEHAVRRLGADVLVIDHIHYILRGGKESNRIQMAEDAMKRLNDMAEKYGIIILLVAQPRKNPSEPGKPKDRMSGLDDIKYAAAIAEDAAAVIHLHRRVVGESAEDDKQQQQSPETMVRMLKGREQAGGKQMAMLYFEGAQARFRPLIGHQPSNDPFNDSFYES